MNSSKSKNNFDLPDFYNFPPLFTIQPVLSTREKQLGQWRELLLKYHTDLKIKTLIPHECPLWNNTSIGRQLSTEGITIVMDDFVRSGHGEWEDDENNDGGDGATRTRCRILWRRPGQLASDVYDWAVKNGYVNSVCTVYELHSGECVCVFYLARCVVLLYGLFFSTPFAR